jgi:hypothetical protein
VRGAKWWAVAVHSQRERPEMPHHFLLPGRPLVGRQRSNASSALDFDAHGRSANELSAWGWRNTQTFQTFALIRLV